MGDSLGCSVTLELSGAVNDINILSSNHIFMIKLYDLLARPLRADSTVSAYFTSLGAWVHWLLLHELLGHLTGSQGPLPTSLRVLTHSVHLLNVLFSIFAVIHCRLRILHYF